MDEPVGAWKAIIDQGPLCAFMLLVIYFGAKFLKKILDDAAARENAREIRYNQLVDKSIENADERTKSVTEALVGTKAVLERVERKLNESPYKPPA